MPEQEVINALAFGMVVAWGCKIGFHFVYLKAVDKDIKEQNFISFYLNFENLFTSVLLVSPFFFSRDAKDQEIKRARKKAKLATYVLGAMFSITLLYLYKHPATKNTTIERKVDLVTLAYEIKQDTLATFALGFRTHFVATNAKDQIAILLSRETADTFNYRIELLRQWKGSPMDYGTVRLQKSTTDSTYVFEGGSADCEVRIKIYF